MNSTRRAGGQVRVGPHNPLDRIGTTRSTVSCSQNRRTDHPATASRASVSRSRRLFSASLAAQILGIRLGSSAVFRHACQKHPSTNTATRSLGNAISARRLGRTGRSTRNRKPRACSSRRTATSGFVSRRRLAIILRDAACDDGAALDVICPSGRRPPRPRADARRARPSATVERRCQSSWKRGALLSRPLVPVRKGLEPCRFVGSDRSPLMGMDIATLAHGTEASRDGRRRPVRPEPTVDRLVRVLLQPVESGRSVSGRFHSPLSKR